MVLVIFEVQLVRRIKNNIYISICWDLGGQTLILPGCHASYSCCFINKFSSLLSYCTPIKIESMWLICICATNNNSKYRSIVRLIKPDAAFRRKKHSIQIWLELFHFVGSTFSVFVNLLLSLCEFSDLYFSIRQIFHNCFHAHENNSHLHNLWLFVVYLFFYFRCRF